MTIPNYVDCIDSLDISYCTIIVDSTVPSTTMKILIGQDPVFRLYQSKINVSCLKKTVSTYGGVGLRRDSNHIILMDSVTFNILKPHITDTLFVKDIYKELKNIYYSDDIPYRWNYELLFDSNGISGIRECE